MTAVEQPRMSPADFMASAAAPAPMAGNSAWANRYAGKVRRVFHEHAGRAPRSNQVHLGPSEIGVECHRQVAGKLAGLPRTNHVSDPWPSIRGTALHAWAEGALHGDNERQGRTVWLPEQRVTPIDGHSGTADAYDVDELAVVDWKFLGETSMAKIRTGNAPRKYRVQLKLYARGYRRLGLPVTRVAIVAAPATASSLDGLYVWEEPYTPADDELLDYVTAELDYRKQWAALLISGAAYLEHVPAVADDGECYFCPFYRPQAARDGGSGCPGPVNAPAA